AAAAPVTASSTSPGRACRITANGCWVNLSLTPVSGPSARQRPSTRTPVAPASKPTMCCRSPLLTPPRGCHIVACYARVLHNTQTWATSHRLDPEDLVRELAEGCGDHHRVPA